MVTNDSLSGLMTRVRALDKKAKKMLDDRMIKENEWDALVDGWSDELDMIYTILNDIPALYGMLHNKISVMTTCIINMDAMSRDERLEKLEVILELAVDINKSSKRIKELTPFIDEKDPTEKIRKIFSEALDKVIAIRNQMKQEDTHVQH
jgi:hypothetical protein